MDQKPLFSLHSSFGTGAGRCRLRRRIWALGVLQGCQPPWERLPPAHRRSGMEVEEKGTGSRDAPRTRRQGCLRYKRKKAGERNGSPAVTCLNLVAWAFSDDRTRDHRDYAGHRGRGGRRGRDETSRDSHAGRNHDGPRCGTAACKTPVGRPVAAEGTPGGAARTPRPAARRLAVRRPRGPDDTAGHQWRHRPTSPLAPGPLKEFQPLPLRELLT